MIEIRQITVTVMVDRETENSPEHWDWRDLTDTWCVPSCDSTLLASYDTRDHAYDAIDSGAAFQEAVA